MRFDFFLSLAVCLVTANATCYHGGLALSQQYGHKCDVHDDCIVSKAFNEVNLHNLVPKGRELWCLFDPLPTNNTKEDPRKICQMLRSGGDKTACVDNSYCRTGYYCSYINTTTVGTIVRGQCTKAIASGKTCHIRLPDKVTNPHPAASNDTNGVWNAWDPCGGDTMCLPDLKTLDDSAKLQCNGASNNCTCQPVPTLDTPCGITEETKFQEVCDYGSAGWSGEWAGKGQCIKAVGAGAPANFVCAFYNIPYGQKCKANDLGTAFSNATCYQSNLLSGIQCINDVCTASEDTCDTSQEGLPCKGYGLCMNGKCTTAIKEGTPCHSEVASCGVIGWRCDPVANCTQAVVERGSTVPIPAKNPNYNPDPSIFCPLDSFYNDQTHRCENNRAKSGKFQCNENADCAIVGGYGWCDCNQESSILRFCKQFNVFTDVTGYNATYLSCWTPIPKSGSTQQAQNKNICCMRKQASLNKTAPWLALPLGARLGAYCPNDKLIGGAFVGWLILILGGLGVLIVIPMVWYCVNKCRYGHEKRINKESH